MCWVMKFVAEDRMWTVGWEDSQGKWHGCFDWCDQQEAMDKIHYLNGGSDEVLERLRGEIENLALVMENPQPKAAGVT